MIITNDEFFKHWIIKRDIDFINKVTTIMGMIVIASEKIPERKHIHDSYH